MLLQFNFKNFKSFRDDTSLDLTATKITEYNNHVVSVGNEKVLPVAVIFGANASGKSNVYQAFNYMASYVVFSFGFGGSDRKTSDIPGFSGQLPFLFDRASQDLESSFEVHFIDSEENGAKSYNYGFTVDNEGIKEEWLNYKSKSSRGDYKRVFYRHRNKDILDMPGIPAKSHENIKVALEKEALIVSLGAKLKIAKLKLIRDWFIDTYVIDFGDPTENFIRSRQLPDGFTEDKGVQQKVAQYFAAFDPSIIDFQIEGLAQNDGENRQRVYIHAVHKMIGSDDTVVIPLELESAGTLKMFALYQCLQDALEIGGVLFIDELNARLHPLLVRNIVTTFLNPEINKKHAQLIFTSHDVWHLNSNLLRRDEVWFTEKSKDGVSTLYSLSDFADEGGAKIRKDENYEKNYLLGKYGAIPTLKCFDIFND